ncbi:Protein kinase domain-containing protein [Entamoeba marina]
MGNTLSTSSDVLNSLDLTDMCGLDEVENIGNDLFTRSVRGRDIASRRLLVTKLYSVQSSSASQAKDLLQRLHFVNKAIVNSNGLLNFVTKKAGKNGSILILQRQFLPYNLADKVRTIPFLNQREKEFIAFQIVNAVSVLHSLNCVHGDLKPENILLTSSNTPYLSDYAPHKPYSIPDDNPYDLNFYFNRSSCLAPERYQSSLSKDNMFAAIPPTADLFSLGCVLAYLFLEHPLFDVSNILDYKTGKFSVTDVLETIQPLYIRELITSLIDPNPNNRPSAAKCFEEFSTHVPQYFSPLLRLSYHSQQTTPEQVIPDVAAFLTEYLNIYKPKQQVEIQEHNEPQHVVDDTMLAHSSQLAGELEKLTKQTEELHEHLKTLLGGQWSDSQARNDALQAMKKMTEDISVASDGDIIQNNDHIETPQFVGRESLFDGAPILLSMLFSIRKAKDKTLDDTLSLIEVLLHYSDDNTLYMIATPGLVDLCLANTSNPIKSRALHMLVRTLQLIEDPPQSAHLLFPNYICPVIEQTTNNKQNLTFSITYSTLFTPILETAKKLALKEENDTMKKSEHEVLCSFFLQSYKQLFALNNFHITRNLIKSYAALTLFCGYQKSYNELLPYVASFQKSEPILLLHFLEQIPLVGKVYGTKIFELHFYPLLQLYLYSTHEYLVHQTLLSLAFCIDLDIISRSYVYSIIPLLCPLLVHPNITLRQATADVLSIIATTLTDAQRHCFLLPHINAHLRIQLFTVTSEHINASLLSSIPRNALRSFFRTDFPPTLTVDDIATRLESTGVTNPDKSLSKLLPYLITVKENSQRLAPPLLFRITDELKVRRFPLWGISLDAPKATYVALQTPTQPTIRDSSRLPPTQLPPRPRSVPDLGYIESDIRYAKPTIIDGICVAHLSEHRTCVTALTVAASSAFFVSGDISGVVKVWDIAGIEALDAMRARAEWQGHCGVTSIGSIAKSNGIIVGFKDGTVVLFRVCVEGKKANVVSIDEVKRIELNSKIISIQQRADPKSVVIVCENGTLAVWDTRDSTAVIKENDVRLGYVTAMGVAPSGNYCIVGTNRGYLVCWDLRHTIANIGWRVPSHSAVSDVVFINEETISTNTRDGDIYMWDIQNQNIRALFHFEDFGTSTPPFDSITEKIERILGSDDYGVQQLNTLLQNLQTCIAQSKNNVYLPYLMNTSLLAYDHYLISGGSDHVLRFWDVDTSNNTQSYAIGDFKKPPTFQSSIENNVYCLKCFPVEREKRGVGITDNDHHLDAITALAILPSTQNNYLCSASRDGVIKIWK